jgi:hypothetical protein
MLLKTKKGCFREAKLVCALPAITYQLCEKTKLNSKLKIADGRLPVSYIDSLGNG